MLGFSIKKYDKILKVLAKICGKLGFLGEILLIPIALTWMCWPMAIPYYYKGNYATYTPSIVFSIIQMVRGYGLIKVAQ